MTKREVTVMLRRYDRLRAELDALEPQLNTAVADYGRANGLYCYNKDALRRDLAREAADKGVRHVQTG